MEVKTFALNYLSLFILLIFTADALDSTWLQGPLFARVQLNLLYNTHGLSILGLCIGGFFLTFYKKDGLAPGVFAAFGVASIHELTLGLVDSFKGIPTGLDPRYVLYLSVFLTIGWFVVRPYHRRVWLAAFVILFAWFCLEYFLGTGSSTLSGFQPSPDYYNPLTNLVEIATWLVPASLWFLPRQLFYRPLEGTPSPKP
jgi:hypothetical protein